MQASRQGVGRVRSLEEAWSIILAWRGETAYWWLQAVFRLYLIPDVPAKAIKDKPLQGKAFRCTALPTLKSFIFYSQNSKRGI